MAPMARDSNGRRLYTAEFKRQQIARIRRGEISAAERRRELGIARSLLQRWKHLGANGSETAVGANEAVVPRSELRAAQQRIRELERALGRKTMEVELSRLPCIAGRPARRVQARAGRPVSRICGVLRIGRATAYRVPRLGASVPRCRGHGATRRPRTAPSRPRSASCCASERPMATAGRRRS